jgi:putative thioredoxin
MSSTPFVHDVNTRDFAQKVLERSATVPVVVDFWAPWCGPCRVLGPLLEAEVQALAGRVEMAKINTDENQELAQRFGIQGIPAVKAFRDGKVVAEFVGAQPAANVRAFFKQLAPPASLAALDRAAAALADGRADEAEAALRPLLDDKDVGSKARLALVRALSAGGKPAEARAELARLDPRSPEALQVPTVERQLALADDAAAYGGEAKARAALAAKPGDLEASYALASALAARGQNRDEDREALELFLDVVTRNRKFKDDGARTAMLAIFDRLGKDSDLASEFRRRLQIVL